MSDRLSDAAIARLAYRAGFRGRALVTAVAVALAESGGHAHATGDVPLENRVWGPSIGLWQIRSLRAQTGTGGQRDERANLDPATNARHAYQISGHGRDWRPWSTYLNGAYRGYLDRATAAARTAGHGGGRPHPAPAHHPPPARHGYSGRIVLDLAELRRLAALMDTSRERVEHSARVARSLAAAVASTRGLDPATARTLADLFDALDGPGGLPMSARHLDFEARLVRRVHDLAVHADGPDGRYGPEDLVPFLRRNGVPDTLPEAAVVEALAAGGLRRGHTVRAPHVPHLPPAHRMKSGDFVPAALRGFHNGHLPAAQLASIGAGQRLYRPVARWFTRMTAAAGTAGIRLTPTSGYRDVAQQRRLYDLYRSGRGNLAAPPGHSNHGWGLSVDIDVRSDPHALRWLHANGSRFGFFNDVPGEPWHWTYRPA